MIIFYDSLGKGEAQTPSAFLGSETRGEHVLLVFLLYPFTCVTNLNDYTTGLVVQEETDPSLTFHGVNGILTKVLNNPLQQRLVHLDNDCIIRQTDGD